VIKALRFTLFVLNSIAIISATYFLIFGNDLGGEPFETNSTVRLILCLSIIIVAIVGIIGAVWWGNKTKTHLIIIIGYLISALGLMLIGLILDLVYVRNINSAGVKLGVLIVILSNSIVLSSIGFIYVLNKNHTLKKLNAASTRNLFTSTYLTMISKII